MNEIRRVACGCEGQVLQETSGRFPVLALKVTLPCAGGHPGKVVAGVIERFIPEVTR